MIFENLVKIFRKKAYVALAIVVAIAFYTLNFWIAQRKTLASFFKNLSFSEAIGISFNSFLGFYNTIKLQSILSLIILSVLTGLFVACIVFKVNYVRKSESLGIVPAIGIGLGLFGAGCASCGIGLAALLGFGGIIATLPLEGLEISILAIVVISYSIWNILKKVDSCDVRIERRFK